MPRGGDLLHERDVRRGQPLVLCEQRVRLVDLSAEPLLQRRQHVRLGRQGTAAVAMAREVAEMRRLLLEEAVGVAGRQAGRVAEVVGVVARGQARRLAVVVDVVMGQEVGVVRVAERRRMRVVASAAAAGVGVWKWVAVAAGHGESPDPYRWRGEGRLFSPMTFFGSSAKDESCTNHLGSCVKQC